MHLQILLGCIASLSAEVLDLALLPLIRPSCARRTCGYTKPASNQTSMLSSQHWRPSRPVHSLSPIWRPMSAVPASC